MLARILHESKPFYVIANNLIRQNTSLFQDFFQIYDDIDYLCAWKK